MTRSSSSHQQRRRYVDANGRLAMRPRRRHLSIVRCGFVGSLILALILGNPANHFSQQQQPTILPSFITSKFLSKDKINNYNYKHGMKITNFGLFALGDHRSSRTLSIVVMNTEWTLCSYDAKNDDSSQQLSSLESFYKSMKSQTCRNVLKQHGAHGKPVFYDPSDRPYTTYRILVGMLMASLLWTTCCYSHSSIQETSRSYSTRRHDSSSTSLALAICYIIFTWLRSFLLLYMDSLQSFFFFPDSETTIKDRLETFLYQWVSLAGLAYPAFQAMDTLISLQSNDPATNASRTWWFLPKMTTMEAIENWNYVVAVLLLISMAVLINAITPIITHNMDARSSKQQQRQRFILDQFDALSACCIGYVTFYQQNMIMMMPWNTTSEIWWWSTILNDGISANNIHGHVVMWTFICILILRRQSLYAVIYAVAAYMAGQALAKYHYENIVVVAFFRQGWRWFETTWMEWERWIQELLFG